MKHLTLFTVMLLASNAYAEDHPSTQHLAPQALGSVHDAETTRGKCQRSTLGTKYPGVNGYVSKEEKQKCEGEQ